MKVFKNNSYVLKHFDDVLIEFEFNHELLYLNTVHITNISANAKKNLPISLTPTDEGLGNWLKNRSVPKNREFIKELINSMGLNIDNVQSLLDVSKGLSLNDAYWICKKNEHINFDDINLYENDFSSAISLVAFTGFNTKIEALCSSPEFTTTGMLPKCWRRINNETILFKGGTRDYANAGHEPYSEYYASQIAQKLGYNHIDYGLEKWKGILASTCPLFTSKNTGYVPIAYYVPSGNIGAVNDYIKTLSSKNLNLSNMYKDFQRMILFDALIYNKDRHFGNFGFMVDNRTLEIKGLNPIFDNGAGLFAYALDSETKDLNVLKKYASTDNISYYGLPYDDVVKAICSKDMAADLRKLINFKFVRHPKYNLSEERLNSIEQFINERAIELLNIVEKCPNKESQKVNYDHDSHEEY